MALTGIDIYKKLPKKNCGECGVPTCLAFAMSLAAGKAELSACPYVTDEVKKELSEASQPPIRTVCIGAGEKPIKIGGETVMFRHEKTFVNPPAIAVLVTDAMDDKEISAKLSGFNQLKYERVGLTLQPELVAVKCASGDGVKFESLVNKVKAACKCGIILMADNPSIIAKALGACKQLRPLIYPANSDNLDEMAKLAKENACPIAVKGKDVNELIELTAKLETSGVKDIVLDPGSRTPRRALEDEIIIRRSAIFKKFRPLGFPTITFPCEMEKDPAKEALIASMLIAKYAGVIVLSQLTGELLFPLLLERLNIYTDPQRPMATKQGIYAINNPDETSPLLVTTNFSLTYFIVSGEIESSRVPAWLLVQDAEGLSVLTAWAADKFVAETIAQLIKKSGISDKIKHKKLLIPGYVAQISGDLEEELPGWQITVGPREATHLPAFLKQWKA